VFQLELNTKNPHFDAGLRLVLEESDFLDQGAKAGFLWVHKKITGENVLYLTK
jgi:hypothetical protein